MGNLSVLETEFYTDLDHFKTLSLKLIDNGQPYAAVVMSHELFRFLYPVEPQVNFKHTDPVPYSVQHIKKLLAYGEQALASVHGYGFDMSQYEVADAELLETRTSDLYSSLWAQFEDGTLTRESRQLVESRIPADVIETHIKGKRVLDMGCGSGRYSLALALLGAGEVLAVDFQGKAFRRSEQLAKEAKLPITFQEANVLELSYADRSFDFVFSNGVLHHTRDWRKGVQEFARLMKASGYLYLYATGGFFWTARRVMREIFSHIPKSYAQSVLKLIGMPGNRFIFMDTWYVPVEGHLVRSELEDLLTKSGTRFRHLQSQVPFDPDYGLSLNLPGGEMMWGEGEHRYLVEV